jgi:uncharacterized protein YneF (UPF0154 family)
MSTWVIISWVLVFLLTAINIGLFLKLKQASEQMMKMAFPNAKNMNEAMAQMQGMLGGMQGKPGRGGRGGNPFGGMPKGALPRGGAGNMDAQLKAAMEMLQKQKKGKR